MDQRFVIAIFSGFLHPIANQGGLDADGRCPLLWFWHRGSATLQAVIAGWKADHDQHNDVLNLVKQFDLLGWLCCQECLRWSAGGCGITYVVEATWSQSQGHGLLHHLNIVNGWTDATIPHWREKASFKLTLTPSRWSMHILDGSWWGFWRQKVR